MNIIKTATIVGVILILFSVASYFIPYEQLINQLPYVKDFYNNTSITVNSKNGKAVISINGQGYGETPVNVHDLAAGDYDVLITRVSTSTDFYPPKSVRITLERGTEAVIDMELGPEGITSGYTLYYTKSSQTSSSEGFMTISSDPTDSNVYLDDNLLQKAPINALKLSAKNYQLKVTHDGYEAITFPIIVRNGYNLNIVASLYPIPTVLTK